MEVDEVVVGRQEEIVPERDRAPGGQLDGGRSYHLMLHHFPSLRLNITTFCPKFDLAFIAFINLSVITTDLIENVSHARKGYCAVSRRHSTSDLWKAIIVRPGMPGFLAWFDDGGCASVVDGCLMNLKRLHTGMHPARQK